MVKYKEGYYNTSKPRLMIEKSVFYVCNFTIKTHNLQFIYRGGNFDVQKKEIVIFAMLFNDKQPLLDSLYEIYIEMKWIRKGPCISRN